jgi:hypothetical protein
MNIEQKRDTDVYGKLRDLRSSLTAQITDVHADLARKVERQAESTVVEVVNKVTRAIYLAPARDSSSVDPGRHATTAASPDQHALDSLREEILHMVGKRLDTI